MRSMQFLPVLQNMLKPDSAGRRSMMRSEYKPTNRKLYREMRPILFIGSSAT